MNTAFIYLGTAQAQQSSIVYQVGSK